MKIAMISSAKADPSTGVGSVSLTLKRFFTASGHFCKMFFFEDVISARKSILTEAIFSLLIGLKLRIDDFDILDVTAGDGAVLALRGLLPGRHPKPVLVARSHGLEHVIHESNLARAKAGTLKLSWRYPIYHGGFRLWQVRQFLRRADLTLFLNAYDRAYAVEKLGVRAETAEIVDNGIPDIFLAQKVSFEPKTELKIALIGSFLQRKGVDYSVPALNGLLRSYDGLSVTFFGTGVPKAEVLNGFDSAVVGRVDAIMRYEHGLLPDLLRDFDILLFPSLTEGFGLAVVEGMACGLAAVVSGIPGIADRLLDGVNAIIIPPKDQAAIEHAVRRLVDDPALLQKLRRAGYEFAQNFSWRRIAEQNLALYEKAAARKRAGRSA